MSNDHQLKTFREADSTTSYLGQQRAGAWEAGAGTPLSSQRPWETFDAFAAREGAYNASKKGTGGT